MSEAKLLSDNERVTKTHYCILGMCWAGWLFDFYDLILYSFLLIPISKDMHFSDMETSVVLGISLGMTAVGGALFGYLADRFGRKTVLQWTILTYSIGTLMCAFTANLWWLIFWRSITGLGVGGEWATGQTCIGETFPPKVRGRFGAFMQTGAPLGIALASLVGSFFAPVFGWRMAFIVSALPALMVLLIRRCMPESDLWELRRKERAGVKEPNKFLSLFSPEIRKIFIFALILTTFDMCAYWFTYSWLPTYLHRERHFTLALSGIFILVTQAGGFIGYTTFGFVSDKFGRRPAYTVYSLLMAVGLLMITLFWDVVVSVPHLILVFMFIVGLGTGMFGGYGPLFTELFPTGIRSTAMGTAFNFARGIQFFTPIAITIIAQNYGLSGGISLAALFAVLTGLWIWVFPETRGRRLTID